MVPGVACAECTKYCKKLHRKTKEQQPEPCRFFKVMFGEDHTKVLYLPPEFARTVQHLANQETQIEDRNGQRWSLTVSKYKGSLAFRKGWPEFFLDHGLKQGEVVIFEYIKGSHFFARIFGKSAGERINFNREIPRQNKRPRRGQVIASEDEPIQAVNINSGDKPSSATSVAVGPEFQTSQANHEVTNGNSGRTQRFPICIDLVDPTCMISRNEGNYQGEDRNFLYDLSSFEMQNGSSEKFQKVPSENLELSGDDAVQKIKTTRDDGNFLYDLSRFKMQNGTSEQSKFEKVPSKKLEFSGDDAEQTKTMRDDAQMGVVYKSQTKGHSAYMVDDLLVKTKTTDQMKGLSGDIFSDKSERALETKTVPNHIEVTKQTIKKEDTQKATAHSGGIGNSKIFKKPSDNINLGKDMSYDVTNVQNGNSKIAEGSHVGKSWIRESSVSNSIIKDLSGKPPIKREWVETEDASNGLPQVSCGKEPSMAWNNGQMISPEVKVELDQSDDIAPTVDIRPFSAEVKSNAYLELPAEFPTIRVRKDKGKGKVVYLKDSTGRVLPVICSDLTAFKALTVNWSRFYSDNNLKPGDVCWFQVEKGAQFVLRVDVARSCGDSTHK